MKIGYVDMAFNHLPADVNSSNRMSQTGFQMMLGSLLQNDKKIVHEQDLNPIAKLLDIILDNDGADFDMSVMNMNTQADIEVMVEELFPDWREAVDKIFQSILHAKELMSKEELDKLTLLFNELQTEDFLSSTAFLFQALNDLNRDILRALPMDEIAALIKTGREVQGSPQFIQVTLAELKNLDQLDQSIQQLVHRLQEINKEIRLQKFTNTLDLAFSKNTQTQEMTRLPNRYSVFQPLPGQLHVEQSMETESGTLVNLNQQHLGRTEQFVLHVGDRSNHETVMRDLVKEFSNILSRSSLTQGLHTTKLLIRLYPEQLGSLRVELLQKDGLMMARMMASTSMAKEMLESQLHSLRQAFTQQNIQIDKIEVTFSQEETQKYTSQDGRGNQHDESSRRENDLNLLDEEDSSFKETLSNVLFEQEA